MNNRIRTALASTMVAGVLLTGQPAHAAPTPLAGTAAAAGWEHAVSIFVTFPWPPGWAACKVTGDIGLATGLWRNYNCETDFIFTTYLNVLR
jgi:hypothetical protein